MKKFSHRFNFQPTETASGTEINCLLDSLKNWQPFPDTVAALTSLKQKYKRAVISNIDDDLFAGTAQHLKVEFDWLIAAEQVRSYKPSTRHSEIALETMGKSQTRQNRIWGDTAGQRPARLGSARFENIGGNDRVNNGRITPISKIHLR